MEICGDFAYRHIRFSNTFLLPTHREFCFRAYELRTTKINPWDITGVAKEWAKLWDEMSQMQK